eukprot:5146243-Amphidinium_carterae.1
MCIRDSITFVAAADSNTRRAFAMPLTRKGATDFAMAKLLEWLRCVDMRAPLQGRTCLRPPCSTSTARVRACTGVCVCVWHEWWCACFA